MFRCASTTRCRLLAPGMLASGTRFAPPTNMSVYQTAVWLRLFVLDQPRSSACRPARWRRLRHATDCLVTHATQLLMPTSPGADVLAIQDAMQACRFVDGALEGIDAPVRFLHCGPTNTRRSGRGAARATRTGAAFSLELIAAHCCDDALVLPVLSARYPSWDR